MQILSDHELERALAEFHGLKDALPDTGGAARRDELDAAIRDYYARNKDKLRKGRPDHVE